MRIILLGPPGCGKGTQAERIAGKLGISRLTTGEMLRAAVRDGTTLGKVAKQHLDNGTLVPDEVVIGLMREQMAATVCNGGFLLDGFPRSPGQAKALDVALSELGQSIDHVIVFDAPEAEIVRRLAGRRECRQCGAGYHVEFGPPALQDQCDRCGGKLVQRSDDNEATIRRRLQVYAGSTAPLVDFYQVRGVTRRLDAVGTVDAVFSRICSLIAI